MKLTQFYIGGEPVYVYNVYYILPESIYPIILSKVVLGFLGSLKQRILEKLNINSFKLILTIRQAQLGYKYYEYTIHACGSIFHTLEFPFEK